MGERTGYTPGTFSWTDLTTTDQEGAKAFYSGLFGWVAEDLPVGDDVYYSIQRKDGKDVAAISPQQEAQREAGAPPTWNSYVSVESADVVADRAKGLGATIVAPPFDVMSAFYAALFDWTVEPFEGSPEPYLTIKNGDVVNGGIRTLNSPGPPPHWLVYFAVDDLDASLAQVSELGGATHAGPIDIGIARIAVVADPQGAMFALYDGRLDP